MVTRPQHITHNLSHIMPQDNFNDLSEGEQDEIMDVLVYQYSTEQVNLMFAMGKSIVFQVPNMKED